VDWLVFLGVLGAMAVALALGLLLRVPQRLTELFREERAARRDAEEGAEASRALAHVREAVLLLDTSGDVRYANPTAQEWFGLGTGTGAGVLAQLLEQFEAPESATRPVTVEGRERWLVGAQTAFDGGRVLVLRDVSDERGLERLRADFVATAAHELRTPLAAVYGAVRTLRQSDYQLSAETSASLLEMIEVEADRLRIIMDQLLVSAQIDSDELQLHRRRVDAVALVEDLARSAELHKPDAVVLLVETDERELPVDADPDRLRQVVANLLDNAIKYSPDGGTIHVRLSGDGDTGVVEVADTGIGIPFEEQARIFEKFYRLDPDMTHGVGGSGLGLYISRELVRQMGGELTVSSRYGRGSTFSIRLPLMRDRTRTAPSRAIPSATPPPSSKV
ncbi:MAG: PAS domain-containing protein, partial [Actinobacteria bacterium]|nr:PAS domain-containing protein [Actinomycetota bacterium]